MRVERPIELPLDRVLRRRQRTGVAGECVGRAAKRIARELIEQHDARQGAERRRAPLAEGARDAGGECDAESLADLAIECVVLAEPDVARDPHSRLRRILSRLRREPEIENPGRQGRKRRR